MEVLAAGASKKDVAARYGVSRQSVHQWVRCYQVEGLQGRADQSDGARAAARPLELLR